MAVVNGLASISVPHSGSRHYARRNLMARAARSIRLLGAVAIATGALVAPVLGQGFDLRSLFGLGAATTGTVPPAGPAQSAAPDWSGESGASGHPLMTAEAIRAAAANFRGCLAGLWPLAERRGVPRQVFEAQVATLTPDLRIMDLLDAQPEFTKSLWDYLDLLVSEERIKSGRAILARHRAAFEAVEKA